MILIIRRRVQKTSFHWLGLSTGNCILMRQTAPFVRIRSARESQVHYDGNLGKATFDITFDKETELTGYMKLHLWVEADGNDDMDLFVAIQKLDKNGKWLPTYVLGKPHPGTPGKLRVSLRETDPEKSTEFQPLYPYNNPQKLKAGRDRPYRY